MLNLFFDRASGPNPGTSAAPGPSAPTRPHRQAFATVYQQKTAKTKILQKTEISNGHNSVQNMCYDEFLVPFCS